jgi:PhzF family phenazine biosynthesis protein
VTRREFKQIDVFGREPYLGNPLAVVLDGSALSTQEMQQLARWTNLSETTFLLPPVNPDADYRVRIFTPVRELPFAGHPTLGSAHAWLEAGGNPKQSGFVVQECQVGLVRVRKNEHRLAFAAPKRVKVGPVDEDTLQRIARGLHVARDEIVQHQWVDNGPGWVAVMLRSAQDVLKLEPDYASLDGLELGVVGAYPMGSECQFEVRAFVTIGTRPYEDPVTGSLNASLAQWLTETGLAAAQYTTSQGTRLGRAGRVHLERDADGQVWVGGETITCVKGQVML